MPDFPLKLAELLDVKIEKLSFGGSGIARHAGVVIFVPFAAPGDHLQIKITQIKKRHAEAEIQKILSPGPDRSQPPCSVYGHCGGCNWQHLTYESQLRFKQEIVMDFLKKFISAESRVLPIVPSPQPLHYRHRSQLKFKDGKLGFFKKNSHEIVDIDRCWIVEESLSKQIPQMKKDLQQKNAALAEPLTIELTPPNGSDGFSQVNRFQNENLVTATITALTKNPLGSDATFYDLYAGSGNFTFPLIDKAGKSRVIGVEMHAGAAKMAQGRLRRMGLSPKAAEFYNSDVGLFLRRFPVKESDAVLLDPPRMGCSEEVIALLAKASPQSIVYISCDPAALARDLERLWRDSGEKYRLEQVQCFDMFPQTHHVETLVEIRREPNRN